MSSIVQSIYLDSEIGAIIDLDPAGTSLENAYAYDSAARDVKAMAADGRVRIVGELLQHPSDAGLITRISFEKLR